MQTGLRSQLEAYCFPGDSVSSGAARCNLIRGLAQAWSPFDPNAPAPTEMPDWLLQMGSRRVSGVSDEKSKPSSF